MKNLIKSKLPSSMNKTLVNWNTFIMTRFFLKKLFKKIHGYELNLKNPNTFNEKIQFRKKYGNKKFMALIADKYKVREYVADLIGEEYLIPLVGVYDKITVEDLEKLPNQFVIKTNHASGSNHIEIVRNKNKINLEKLVIKMNKATKEKYGYRTGEDFYDLIKPRIMVEELLLDNNQIPEDYKFHCFKNGQKYIEVISLVNKEKKYNFYDLEWEKIDFNPKKKNNLKIEKPQTFPKMIEKATELMRGFDYIRVDFYSLEDKIYFGELTQTHGNGFSKTLSRIWDEKFGNIWNLDSKNEKLYVKNNPLNEKNN